MAVYKESINSKIFEQLMLDIFSLYQRRLREIKMKKNHVEIREVICKFENEEVFKPRRPYGKHIFARKDAPEYYYSIGAVIANELDKINENPDADLSDFIYKKCIAFNNQATEIEVYIPFFEILKYKSIKSYCADKKNLNYDELRIGKQNISKSNSTREVRLQKRLKGNWWLYFFNNEGFGKPSFAIARLEINQLNDIKLFNDTTESSIDYYGKIDESVTKIAGIVYLRFTPVNKWENRNLRIALHISEDINIDLAIGQYSNIDSGVHLIRGSICMERITRDDITDYEKDGKRNIEEIPEEFRNFLANKPLNFNRLPNNQHNLVSFKNWLDEQKGKRHIQRTKIMIENKKLFISCPINSVTAEQFEELKKVVNKIKAFFEDEGFTQTFAFISELKNQKAKENTPKDLEYPKIMKKFIESSYHMVIWPLDLKISGIIFEIGWAAIKECPVAIFEQVNDAKIENIKSQIPHLLDGACTNKETGIAKYAFEEFDGIIEILKTNSISEIFINPRTTDDY